MTAEYHYAMPKPTPSAIVSLPAWTWGGNPAGIFNSADFHARRLNSTNQWKVRTVEQYLHRRPDLVKYRHLAGPMVSSQSINELAEIAKSEPPLEIPKRIWEEIDSQAERASTTGDIVDWLAAWSAQTQTARPEALADTVQSVYENLGKFTLEGDQNSIVFENRGVHIVRREDTIAHRIKLITLLLRIEYDQRLAAGDTSEVSAMVSSGGLPFSSSAELINGSLLFDAYISPLCSALAPAIWCIPVQRSSCAIIYTLGQPLAGTKRFATELLQLLPVPSERRTVKVPNLSASASSDAIHWWTDRLNEMFAVITDPSVFVDSQGHYSAASHLHAVLTIEQLFRRVHSIQTVYKDANARRVLLFTVLDTLERLTGRNLETHCQLRFAKKTYDALVEEVPKAAAEVLLPGARRAVTALRNLQDGFFMASNIAEGYIDIPAGGGSLKRLALEDAASQYLKIQRDATHGHGSNREHLLVKINALLAHHNGSFPHDLALLGYLYLLDILANPANLRRKLSSPRQS